MRTTLRIAAPLVLSLTVAQLAFVVYQVRTERQALRADLARRVAAFTASLQKNLEPFDGVTDANRIHLLTQFSQRDPLRLVAVYDIAGRQVATLTDGESEPGRYLVTWSGGTGGGRIAGAGVYFVRMTASSMTSERRFTSDRKSTRLNSSH